jgi:hypothetical protein
MRFWVLLLLAFVVPALLWIIIEEHTMYSRIPVSNSNMESYLSFARRIIFSKYDDIAIQYAPSRQVVNLNCGSW